MADMEQVELQTDDYCFACGRDNPHGLGMRLEFTQGEARCLITLPRHYQGWAQIAHGGIVSTLLDEVMAWAVVHYEGNGVTASQQTRFREPVPLDTELYVRGWVEKRKGRLALTRAEVSLAGGGNLLAEAEGKFIIRS